jgi:CubicO group peptidase (beta-lactamase class C family)
VGAGIGWGMVLPRLGPVLLALALLAACSADEGTAGSAPPTLSAHVADNGWEPVDPASVGLDAAVLEDIASRAEADDAHCLVVVKDGRLAGEWSWAAAGTTEAQEVFSITKSITSTVTGIAIEEGHLALDDPASTWIEEWRGTPADAVTVRNLLSNDSGRFWSFDTDYTQLAEAEDATAFAIGLEQADPPGTTWEYNNAAIQTLERVLSQATGEGLPELVEDRLLDPLGMDDSELATDRAGNGLAFVGLQSTCRDLARFGLMVLDGGRWGDEQIVSEGWLSEATSPSQDLSPVYGYLWWLNRPGPISEEATDPSDEGPRDVLIAQMVDGAPPDVVWALGLGDQILQIHRPTATVVVRLGPGRASPGDFDIHQAARVVTEATRG